MKWPWIVLLTNISHVPVDIYNIYNGKNHFLILLVVGIAYVSFSIRTISGTPISSMANLSIACISLAVASFSNAFLLIDFTGVSYPKATVQVRR